MRLGEQALHEVGLVNPSRKKGQALLGILRPNGLEQPLPGGDIAGGRCHRDPIIRADR
jgi:hypothetical protein